MAATTLRAALAEVLATTDGADNNNMSDVVGNKSDTVAGDSLVALVKSAIATIDIIDEHLHSVGKVYPTLASGITVNTGAGAWELGAATEIVPINTITMPFDIHYVNIGSVSANDTYELKLFSDAACTVPVTSVRFTRTAVQASTSSTPSMSVIVAANSGIWGKVASSSGSDSIVVSLSYHDY